MLPLEFHEHSRTEYASCDESAARGERDMSRRQDYWRERRGGGITWRGSQEEVDGNRHGDWWPGRPGILVMKWFIHSKRIGLLVHLGISENPTVFDPRIGSEAESKRKPVKTFRN
jgi:hypothetical protein